MFDEPLLTLEQAAELFPSPVKKGETVSPSTVLGWNRDGRLIHGQLIRLRVEEFGGCVYTTRTWLVEFSASIKRARENHDEKLAGGERHPDASRTQTILAAAGI